MAYVITKDCADKLDGACVKVCPVDCIYLGERIRYINPRECIDCGACEQICPVQAIYHADDVPDDLARHVDDNDAFFTTILRGRSEPLGDPRGAKKVGTIGVDTDFVASLSVAEN